MIDLHIWHSTFADVDRAIMCCCIMCHYICDDDDDEQVVIGLTQDDERIIRYHIPAVWVYCTLQQQKTRLLVDSIYRYQTMELIIIVSSISSSSSPLYMLRHHQWWWLLVHQRRQSAVRQRSRFSRWAAQQLNLHHRVTDVSHSLINMLRSYVKTENFITGKLLCDPPRQRPHYALHSVHSSVTSVNEEWKAIKSSNAANSCQFEVEKSKVEVVKPHKAQNWNAPFTDQRIKVILKLQEGINPVNLREQLTTSRLGQHQCLIVYFTWRTFHLKQHAPKNATKVTLVALQILLTRSAVCAEQRYLNRKPKHTAARYSHFRAVLLLV